VTVTEHEQRGAAPPRRLPAWAGPAGLAAAALGAGLYVAATNPAEGGAFIPCPFHRLTGLWCPGCGMTRAAHHLLNGDLVGALSRNLLLPVVLVIGVWAWVAWVARTAGRPARGPDTLPSVTWAVLGVMALGFAVVRNLPFAAGLAP
jgi:hypothetical protein